MGGGGGGEYYSNWPVLKERKKRVSIKITDKNLHSIWGDGLTRKWHFFSNTGNYTSRILFNESKTDRQ